MDKSDTDRIERKREMKKTATFLIGVLLSSFFSSSAVAGHGKGHSGRGGGGGSSEGGHFRRGHFSGIMVVNLGIMVAVSTTRMPILATISGKDELV